MKKQPDYEGLLLELGWDTESTSSTRMRAFKGTLSTEWLASWKAVYEACPSAVSEALAKESQ